MPETTYKVLIDSYLSHRLTVDEFINSFMKQWKNDREYDSFDPRFRRLIDRLFTSCDCYCENPETPFQLSEIELKNEIQLLRHIWWG